MAFDTGNSINAIVIEDIHIRDNKLPVFFFQKPNDSVGMALVSDFEIGSLIAQNTPCIILKNHTAIKFLESRSDEPTRHYSSATHDPIQVFRI